MDDKMLSLLGELYLWCQLHGAPAELLGLLAAQIDRLEQRMRLAA